ncbi:MAG TPA: 2-oxo-4-hydroxy-4-carboxy-5-ureidoimidazoline decarboxylase [Casimicrobiaceae bacterium]
MADATMTSLRELNEAGVERFVGALAEIFEHSPWVAERAYPRRPFDDVAQLHRAMVDVVNGAGRDAQVALLRAHPQLAGREAQTGTLTGPSTQEQSSAGLSALTRAEMERITRFNAAYLAKFGFPFIVAVRNYTKRGILREFERRLGHDAQTEFATCLEQVYEIALIRLEALLGEA